MKHISYKILFPILVFITLSLSFTGKLAYAATPGKVLELLLNEGTGVIAQDSSGNGNNATITGSTWSNLTTGKSALQFNGLNSYVDAGNKNQWNLASSSHSFELWFNASNLQNADYVRFISRFTGGTPGAGYYIGMRSTGYLVVEERADGGNSISIQSSITYNDNKWHQLVYSVDTSAKTGTIYIDGIIDRSDNYSGNLIDYNDNLYIGGIQTHYDFNGLIGEVHIYNQVFSPADIMASYLATHGSYYQIPTTNTIYVYPAVTDSKIFPYTVISNEYISNNINMTSSPGEYDSSSFVIYAAATISSLTVTLSDLTGTAGTISGNAIDLRVVKDWYQAGVNVDDTTHKALTPELLLKDDSLVQIQGTDNYVKYTDSTLHNISGASQPEGNAPTIAQMPIQDASTLQPVDIPSGTNKQFWITVNTPSNAGAGNYSGTITLTTAMGSLGQLQLNLRVLPISLSAPYLTYSAYYTGILNSSQPQGSISSSIKSETQLNSEMLDMINHGITDPASYQPFDQTLLGKVLTLRNNLGIGGQPLYYLGLGPWGYQSTSQVQQVITLAQSYGIPGVYFYGVDEATGATLTNQRTSWQAIRGAGGKMFAAGFTANPLIPPENFTSVGDLLDLFIYGGVPTAAEAARWHSIGHKIFSYENPQLGVELPETYRMNYGLLLWQQDYDGAMDFAYQYNMGNIWNDFDNSQFRDHVMAYPTINGVIDTIQWEGFREGVNDVRYLTTLLNTIKQAKAAGADTSAAESWLAALKTSDLSTQDLDTVRSTMIDYILALQTAQTPVADHITVSPSNPSLTVGGNVNFSAQGYDSSNNPVSGLTYTWSVTNGAAGSINSSGLFTAGATAGAYTNVVQVTSGGIIGTASVTVTPRQFPAWDINMDGKVNVLDMILVGQHQGETGVPGWLRQDVNADGVINVLDNIIISQHWTQ